MTFRIWTRKSDSNQNRIWGSFCQECCASLSLHGSFLLGIKMPAKTSPAIFSNLPLSLPVIFCIFIVFTIWNNPFCLFNFKMFLQRRPPSQKEEMLPMWCMWRCQKGLWPQGLLQMDTQAGHHSTTVGTTHRDQNLPQKGMNVGLHSLQSNEVEAHK